MKKFLKRPLIFIFVCVITALLTVIISAADSSLPISILVTGSDGSEYAVEASPTKGKHSMFYLPGSVDLSKLTVKYTGRQKLCDEDGEPTVGRGETAVFDASSGKIEVKEYNRSSKKYTTYTANVMQGGSVGSVHITLDGGEKALMNINASKENIETGEIAVLDKHGNSMYSGNMTKMKGHGFTSFTAAYTTNVKNSYNFNIENKAELLYGAGESRKWVLLTPRMNAWDRDTSGLSQIAAFHTFTALIGGSRESIEGEYVDLYINGEYRGLYILTERMNEGGAIDVRDLEDHVTDASGDLKLVREGGKNNNDPAIQAGIQQYTYDRKAKLDSDDTDITGGYVLEVMCGMYEGCGFLTKNGMYISVKSPEACTKEMMQYIAEYVQDFENSLFSETGYNSDGKHYTDYADMKSLADIVLVYSYYINFEFFRTSTYMYKDADGKANDILTFGPAWDFETSAYNLRNDETLFGSTNNFFYGVHQQHVWIEQLWRHGEFMSYLSSENVRMKDIISQQIGRTESVSVESLESIASAASASADMNYKRWGGTNFNGVFGEYIEAVATRYDKWYDRFWNPETYLIGLESEVVRNEDGSVTIKAVINGQNDGKIRWYKVDPDNPEKFTSVAVFFDEITVPEDGTLYFYTVQGGNNGYTGYTESAVFSKEEIEMTSGNIPATYIELEPDPVPETETETADVSEEKAGCGSSASILPMLVLFTLPCFIKRKRNGRR